MRFSANLSTLFQELPLLERFAAASSAGFGTVEIQFPYENSTEDLVAARDAAGVEIVLFNVSPGDFEAGERGLAALPGREKDFSQALDQACRYVEALGAKFVNALAGIPGDGVEHEACTETFVANLALAAGRLGDAGAKALSEPLNDRDIGGFFAPTSAQIVAAVEAANHANLGLQFDLYHARMMDMDPAAELRRWFPHVGHIQFADAPGRHEPGTGDIDFASALGVMEELGYDGHLGAEYIPSGATEDSFGWMAEFGAL